MATTIVVELALVDGSKLAKAASFIQLEDGSVFSNFAKSDFYGEVGRAA